MRTLTGALVAATVSRMGGCVGEDHTAKGVDLVSFGSTVGGSMAIPAYKLKVFKTKRNAGIIDVLRGKWCFVVNNFTGLNQASFAHSSGLFSVGVSGFFPRAGCVKA